MSTQVGTLQPKARMGRTILPVVILALLVAATSVAIVTSPDRDVARDDTTAANTTAANTAANTPSELRGIAQSALANTAANTPSEVTFGITQSVAANTAANTPSETRFGITQSTAGVSDAAVAARAKQLGVDVGTVSLHSRRRAPTGGGDCPICWKYR